MGRYYLLPAVFSTRSSRLVIFYHYLGNKCKSPGKWETVSINSVKICGITISQANLGRGEEAKDQ